MSDADEIRAVLYIRVARVDERTPSLLERQRDACRRYVLTRQWTLVDEYVDAGAVSAKRPAFRRLIEDARAGAVTHLVMSDSDRIPRMEGVEQLLGLEGVEVHTAAQGRLDDSPLLRVLGAIQSRVTVGRRGSR